MYTGCLNLFFTGLIFPVHITIFFLSNYKITKSPNPADNQFSSLRVSNDQSNTSYPCRLNSILNFSEVVKSFALEQKSIPFKQKLVYGQSCPKMGFVWHGLALFKNPPWLKNLKSLSKIFVLMNTQMTASVLIKDQQRSRFFKVKRSHHENCVKNHDCKEKKGYSIFT